MKMPSRYGQLPPIVRIGLWFVIALVFYSLVGFLAVPALTRYLLQAKLPSILHRQVVVQKVYFNPFTLDMRLEGLAIGKQGSPRQFVTTKELEVNLQAISVIKQALVMSTIRVVRPQIYISLDKKGRFNFQDILNSGNEKKKEAGDEGRFLFSLNNIEIVNGSVFFEDRLKGVSHKMEDIKIGIPFISNLKTKIRIYTKPYFSAVINGSAVEFKAETRPFAKDRSTRLRIKLTDVSLAHYLAYLTEFINFKIDSGSLATDLDLAFDVTEDGSQSIKLDGNMTVASLALSQAGKPFFRVKALGFKLRPSNLFKKEILFSDILVERPQLEVVRYKNGSLNLEHLVKTSREAANDGSTPSKGRDKTLPLDLRVEMARVEAGRIHFRDLAAGNGTYEATLEPIDLLIKDLGTLDKEPARLELALSTARGERFLAKGEVDLNPIGVDLALKLDRLFIPSYRPYYGGLINGDVKDGVANVSLSLHLDSTGPTGPFVTISDLAVEVSKLTLGDKSVKTPPLINIPKIVLTGAEVDLSQKDVHISSILVEGLETQVVIDRHGQVNLSKMVKEVDRPSEKDDVKDETGGSFHFALDKFALKGAKCVFKDFSGGQPVELLISGMDASIAHLVNSPGKRASFDISSTVGRKGRLKVIGSTDFEIKDLEASVSIDRLGVRQFQGYVSRFSNAILYKGRLYAKAELKLVSSGDRGLKVSARGSSSLTGVSILDPVTKRSVFQWKNIEARDFLFENEPFKLHIKKVILDRVAADVFFDKEGRLNLLALKKKEPTQKGKNISAEVSASRKSKGVNANPDISIKLVAFKDCALEIKDFSVSPPFVRSISRLNGQIKSLSSRPDMRAQIDLRALADNSANMELKGLINPLARPLFVDVWLRADGIGMTRFSPYTAKFLGYVIDKGKLTSKVHLVVQGDQIKVDDKVFLDQFDFGHSVESKDAVSLPVKLAIALLKDRQGHINLDIPVRGSMDDPEFSIGGAIMRVIINIFIKAATSPFSLLSAIAGSGEDLQQVEFVPGTSRLDEKAKKKLSTLTKALKDRPALKVELTGYYDPKADPKALADLRFLRLLRKEKMKDLDDEDREKIKSVDDVEIGKEEFKKYLTKAYKEAPFDKPKMFIGLLKKQPPEVMEKMLRDHIKVTEGDLENLALARSQAVQDYLKGVGGIENSRIFITSPMRFDGKGSGFGSVVRLSLK